MWMSVLIVLLCIQRGLTIEPLKESGRINKVNDKAKYENSNDQSIEQYDNLETEYEDEDLGDSPDIDMNKSSIKEGTGGEQFDIKNNKTRNHSLPNLPKLQKLMRLVRAALPNDNSSKIEEVESDMEEDEEFEDAEIIGSTEEQDEAEQYDSIQPTNKEKLIAISERSKRLTINAKKGRGSSSPDQIEIGEDESLNENDGENYGDFLATRKESMTLRSRQRRTTPKGLAYREIPSASTGQSKDRIVKDNIQVSSDNIETKQMTKKSFLHGRKGKQHKTTEKMKSALKSGRDSDFEELKKAYNSLVCSVENFMGLANKTVNKGDANSMSNGNQCSGTQISTYVATKNGYSQTTPDWCANSTEKIECFSTPDDSDFDPGEHNRKRDEDEDISSNLKKKNKGMKMEYPTVDDPGEKPGAYVYNDYESVDPNEYDTNISVKSTIPSSSLISIPKQLTLPQITEIGRHEKYKENSTNLLSSTVSGSMPTQEIPATSRNSYSTNDTTKESTPIRWTTFHYETKIKLRPSRRLARRMTTDFQKILSRRKYHFARHGEQQDVPKSKGKKTRPHVTNHPLFRNVPPSHGEDTEIIEVEYI